MATTAQTASQLLDRLYLEADGKTNQQLNAPHTMEQLCLLPTDADPAFDFLVSRGLINRFGPEIVFLTARGIQAHDESWKLEQLEARPREDGEEAIDGEDAPAVIAAGAPAEDDDRPASPILTHIDLKGEQYSLSLGWVCTIGRAPDNSVHIDDKRASKNHAVLRYENGHYVLEDRASANGTLLNGNYVTQREQLHHNDEIVIGRTLLLFQEPATLSEPGGAPPEELLHATGSSLPPTELPQSYELGADPSGEAPDAAAPYDQDTPAGGFAPLASQPAAPPADGDAEPRAQALRPDTPASPAPALNIPPFPGPARPMPIPAAPFAAEATDPSGDVPAMAETSRPAQLPAPTDPAEPPPADDEVTGRTQVPSFDPFASQPTPLAPPAPRRGTSTTSPGQPKPRPRAPVPYPPPVSPEPSSDTDRTVPAPPARLPDPALIPRTHTLDIDAYDRTEVTTPPVSKRLQQLGESLPEADPGLPHAPSQAPQRAPSALAGDPFFLTLRAIRSEIPSELHNRQGLIEAIDLLASHPYVQIMIEKLNNEEA